MCERACVCDLRERNTCDLRERVCVRESETKTEPRERQRNDSLSRVIYLHKGEQYLIACVGVEGGLLWDY